MDFDKFVVDVEIKLFIFFCDVIVFVGKIFVELFGLICEFNVEVEGIEIGFGLVDEEYVESFGILVEEFNFIVCFYNCFKCEGIYIVGEFVLWFE